jgi:Outer membrane efflux protein
VQAALQSVADALVAYQQYGDVERQLEEEVKALRRAREIADARYRIGYASYFDVINADRDLFVAELALAQTYNNSWDSLARRRLGGSRRHAMPSAGFSVIGRAANRFIAVVHQQSRPASSSQLPSSRTAVCARLP